MPTPTTHDFGNGPVPAHQHPNGLGWVADTATVADTARVGVNAQVYGYARVQDDAEIFGHARIYGSAVVAYNARVYDNAQVYGDAVIRDNAQVCDEVQVYGHATIRDGAYVHGRTLVYGNADIGGTSNVGGPYSISIEGGTFRGACRIESTITGGSYIDATVQYGACVHSDTICASRFTFRPGACYNGTYPIEVAPMPTEDDNDYSPDEDLDDDYEEEPYDGDEDEEDSERQARPARAFKKGDRFAGVEWEFNSEISGKMRTWRERWSAGLHSDGSCGYEAVTPPIGRAGRAKCLTELGTILKGYDVDERCGIHVHVDARDYYWADTYRLLRIYAHVEPLLYLLGGQRRIANTYCAPVGASFMKALRTEDPKKSVLEVVHGSEDGKNTQRFSPSKKAMGRYKGLNLAPWIYGRRTRKKDGEVRPDTTFEFRLHENSKNASRVLAWTELCVDLVDKVSGMNDKEVSALCDKSPLRALLHISPRSKSFILGRIKAWRKAVPTVKYRRIRVSGKGHSWFFTAA